jgi:hypothetical protein
LGQPRRLFLRKQISLSSAKYLDWSWRIGTKH